MTLLVEQLLNGVQYGFMLFLLAAGLTLILITLCFNILGQWLRKKFRENY